jgi:hypothetical protein
MENKIYVSEGHYRDNGGNEYMSIWTYKKKNYMTSNTNDINYQDAKAITCSDKFWGHFNASDRFKEGWMYNIECLKKFYGH